METVKQFDHLVLQLPRLSNSSPVVLGKRVVLAGYLVDFVEPCG